MNPTGAVFLAKWAGFTADCAAVLAGHDAWFVKLKAFTVMFYCVGIASNITWLAVGEANHQKDLQ